MKQLLILRHGPTPWNADKRIQGHTDISLSSTGREIVQSWHVPPQFIKFRCVASPLARAQETARLLGLNPHTETALREMSWGDWEGQNLADLRAKMGTKMSQNEARGLDFCPPGGESPRAVQERLKPWLKSLNQSTLAITHRGVIRALYALARHWDMCSSPPDRLEKFAAHLFCIDEQGHPNIDRLNLNLEGT